MFAISLDLNSKLIIFAIKDRHKVTDFQRHKAYKLILMDENPS